MTPQEQHAGWIAQLEQHRDKLQSTLQQVAKLRVPAIASEPHCADVVDVIARWSKDLRARIALVNSHIAREQERKVAA